MGGGVKEEEKNERTIRSLLKLPHNKRCINCNSLGPQYVCTTFWTFVCTNCSGIHREFTHRVKSISMAKFTSQEVSALKEGGNQHAKDIYFKGLNQHMQSAAPDGSNVERLRDFIRQVYVNKRYTNEKNVDKPPRGPMGDSETRSSSGSRSPPYEDVYDRRSSPGGKSPGFEQANRKSPSRPQVINDWRREDRFGGRKKTEEESHSPEQVKDLGSASPPVARPVRDILGDSFIPLRVIEPPKPQVNQNGNAPANAKPAASSSSLTSTNENPPEVKLETAVSLIDFDADPEPPAPSVAIQVPISATSHAAPQPATASNDNWASFGGAPSAVSLNVSQSPPSRNTVDSLLSQLAAPSTMPAQTSSGPGHIGQTSSQIFAQPSNGHSREQPWNMGHPSNAQMSMSAPSLQTLQVVPPSGHQSSEVKPSRRTELPADLFTVTYPSYHAAAPGWYAGPPLSMHYGMQQCNNTVQPFQNVPQQGKSVNPFDFSSEPPSQTQPETMFPAMASLQSALPPSGMMPSQGVHNHFSIPSQVSGHPSAMPPRFISPQMPENMPPSNLSPIGNMGAPYASTVPLNSPSSFSLGGNPFG